MPGSPPDPSPIMQLTTAYWGSQALFTANRLSLFATLAGKALSAEEVAAAIHAAPRATRLLLNACVALGLLRREGETYANTPMAETFLVPGSPAYLGDAIRYSDHLYATWGRLEQGVREGSPQLPEASYLGDDPERTRAFVYGMHERAKAIGQALVGILDLSGRYILLDVGGGPGTYSALLTGRYPDLRSQVLELPGVAGVGAEILAEMGAGEKVSFLPGDYRTTPWPRGNDVVLISGVLHRESPEGCQTLIRHACEALVPGGLLVVSDVMTDAGGTTPPFATLFGLNMLLTAPEGGVHADADLVRWMQAAGFEGARIDPFPPPMPHRVVSAHRPLEG